MTKLCRTMGSVVYACASGRRGWRWRATDILTERTVTLWHLQRSRRWRHRVRLVDIDDRIWSRFDLFGEKSEWARESALHVREKIKQKERGTREWEGERDWERGRISAGLVQGQPFTLFFFYTSADSKPVEQYNHHATSVYRMIRYYLF